MTKDRRQLHIADVRRATGRVAFVLELDVCRYTPLTVCAAELRFAKAAQCNTGALTRSGRNEYRFISRG